MRLSILNQHTMKIYIKVSKGVQDWLFQRFSAILKRWHFNAFLLKKKNGMNSLQGLKKLTRILIILSFVEENMFIFWLLSVIILRMVARLHFIIQVYFSFPLHFLCVCDIFSSVDFSLNELLISSSAASKHQSTKRLKSCF